MSLSLSALLNPDSSGDSKDENAQPQNNGQNQQISPTDGRESVQSATLLQSPEVHAQLPKYTPPQRPKSSHGNGDSALAAVSSQRRESNTDVPVYGRSFDAEHSLKGDNNSLEDDVTTSHDVKAQTAFGLGTVKASNDKQSLAGVLAPLQVPSIEEDGLEENKVAQDEGDIHETASSDHMDKVKIKQETIASPLESIPSDIRRLSIANSETDLGTSKTLASLKHEHTSRTQSPLRESSLALPSTEDSPSTTTMKKRPPPSRKKGTATTAKKSKVVKKRKPDVKANLKNGHTAASPSPSDGPGDEYDEDESMVDSDEDVEGSGDVYCICRKPDNGTFMIGCDGGCDDWYHGKCVSIEEKDKNLIDKYICPRCVKAGIGQTSWKRICRRQGCRQPARVGKNAGKNGATSKYCSDECGVLFFRQMTAASRGADQSRKVRRKNGVAEAEDRMAAKGGILSSAEVRAMLDQTNTAVELRDLGTGVLSPPATPTESPEREDLTEHDKVALSGIAEQKEQARKRHQMLKDRLKFITMVKNEATRVAAEKELKPKEYCGCDSRLEWSEEEFMAWRQSHEGQEVFMKDSLEGEAAQGHEICTRKKCARHLEWSKLHVDDIRFETTENSDRMRTLEHDERDIRERASARAKARKFGGGDEGTVEMHDVNDPEPVIAPVADTEAMDIDVA